LQCVTLARDAALAVATIHNSIRIPMLTFVLAEPADNFSRNNGMAKGPNRGVALKQDLQERIWIVMWTRMVADVTHLRACFRLSGVMP